MFIKSLCLLGLTVLSLNAMASDTATCRLTEDYYTSKDWIEYHYAGSKVISEQSLTHRDAPTFTIEDSIYPISYSAQFDRQGHIEALLTYDYDQYNETAEGSALISEGLVIVMTDYYNTGKSEYRLHCQLD